MQSNISPNENETYDEFLTLNGLEWGGVDGPSSSFFLSYHFHFLTLLPGNFETFNEKKWKELFVKLFLMH